MSIIYFKEKLMHPIRTIRRKMKKRKQVCLNWTEVIPGTGLCKGISVCLSQEDLEFYAEHTNPSLISFIKNPSDRLVEKILSKKKEGDLIGKF